VLVARETSCKSTAHPVVSTLTGNVFSPHISSSLAFALSLPSLPSPFFLSLRVLIVQGPKEFQGSDPKMEGGAVEFAAASAKDAVEKGDLKDRWSILSGCCVNS